MDKNISLSELLPKERIRIDVEAENWQDAIRQAGNLLVESGAATSNYVEAMIQVATEMGPYIVIAPGVALPHASTASGALQTALSFVKLSKPVNFGNADHDPVRLVLGLSAIDKTAHIFALQALAQVLLSNELVNQLFNASNADVVRQTMHQAEEMITNQ